MYLKTQYIYAALQSLGGTLIPHGIQLGPWQFTTTKGPIAPDPIRQSLQDELHVFNIPEQYFHENTLKIRHLPSDTSFSFTADDALRQWKADNTPPVHVPAAMQWTETRRTEMEAHNAKILDYDWTYTTSYVGTDAATWTASSDHMDRELLTSRDPILLYDEVPLYESELEDHGVSSLMVKIRVMPKCWFVLMRFFLRVDGVMARLREARVFGRVDGGEVLREVRYCEGRFEELEAAGAPGSWAYGDGEAAAMVFSAVAPVGLARYCVEKATLLPK